MDKNYIKLELYLTLGKERTPHSGYFSLRLFNVQQQRYIVGCCVSARKVQFKCENFVCPATHGEGYG